MVGGGRKVPKNNLGGRQIKALELFAGSCTLSKTAREYGHEAYTVDIHGYNDIDLQQIFSTLLRRRYHLNLMWCGPHPPALLSLKIVQDFNGISN